MRFDVRGVDIYTCEALLCVGRLLPDEAEGEKCMVWVKLLDLS